MRSFLFIQLDEAGTVTISKNIAGNRLASSPTSVKLITLAAPTSAIIKNLDRKYEQTKVWH